MNRRNIFVAFILVLAVLLLAGGCGSAGNNNGIDREHFQAVENYVYEIVPAVEGAKYDIDQWFRDIADPQMQEWLECDAEIIAGINDSYLDEDFPDFALIEGWTEVPVTRGDEEWSIEGRELASLIEKIISATEELTVNLQAVSRVKEGVTEKERIEIGEAIEEAYQTALQLRTMFGFES